MAEIFRLKIHLYDADIELEGDGELVHTILTELRENGMGNILPSKNGTPTVSEVDSCQLPTSNDVEKKHIDVAPVDIQSLPAIKDVVIKNFPKTEAEWILIYGLYASRNGEQTFTAEDIRQMYRDSNRFTSTRNKNFITNVKKCVTENFFSSVNDRDYVLTGTGKSTALEILNRSSGQTKQKSRKAEASSAKTNYQMVELGLTQQQRDDLKDYFNSFSKLSNIEKALIITDWLKKNSRITEVNENTIFSALRTIGHSTSFDIKSSITNGKQRNYYVAGNTQGHYQIHHIGEDYVRDFETKRG